jgi:hypothetical protein
MRHVISTEARRGVRAWADGVRRALGVVSDVPAPEVGRALNWAAVVVLAVTAAVLAALDAHGVWSASSWWEFIHTLAPFGVVVTIPIVAVWSWYSLHTALVGFALAVKGPSVALGLSRREVAWAALSAAAFFIAWFGGLVLRPG